MQQKNFLLFLVLSMLLFLGWGALNRRLHPPPPRPTPDENKVGDVTPPLPPPPSRVKALQLALGPLATLVKGVVPPPPKLPVPRYETPDDKVAKLTLGEDTSDSRFHLLATFDPRGAGIRRILLPRFQQTNLDSDLCEPMWKTDSDGKFLRDARGNKIPKPLELVLEDANRANPSNLLYLCDPHNPTDSRPLDTLAKRDWTVVPRGAEGDANKEVFKDKTEDGRQRQSITFRTELDDGLTVTKTYSLVEGDYHLGLEVKLELSAKGADRRDLHIRYQLTGAHGLPIEGKWYTNTFRNALIAEEENGHIWRDFQDMRQIDMWGGGNEVKRQPNRLIRYAGVAVQYFASVIVVDDTQEKGTPQNFLDRARPTLETAVVRGIVKEIDPKTRTVTLTTNDPREKEQTFYLLDDFAVERLTDELAVAFTYYTDSKLRQVVTALDPARSVQPLWQNDITVRVNTDLFKLAPGETITHRYLLYNGPVKPSLLRQQKGDAAVPEAVVNRYVETLHLNTLTDYHSPGWLGSFASSIYWTNLVIHCTNLMHWILGGLHAWIPNYGVCIILLTVMVRGLMFPLSRKQALMGMKMQALAPEMKKMQEKFKDDKQGLVQAQMELYRKHNINPFGTCWLLLLQMPVFMGLYFAFQESINFRLATFWPTWIINLAAPDMLIHWGHNIPWISRPEDYGWILYLGPCFNLLPVIAVVLMMAQQKMMTPPPTDEQQAMQQKIMKYMMVFFGLMFYKVAAGLCVYFIASSIWGFAERKLLPKIQPAGAGPAAGTVVKEAPALALRPHSENVMTADGPEARKSKQTRNKKKERGRPEPAAGKAGTPEEDSKTALGRFRNWIRTRRQRLRDWWTEVLKQAEKK